MFEVLSDFMANFQVLWKDLCRIPAQVCAYGFPSGFTWIFVCAIAEILQYEDEEDEVTFLFILMELVIGLTVFKKGLLINNLVIINLNTIAIRNYI